MQNRIDELFAVARIEEPFYAYTEAATLVKTLPVAKSISPMTKISGFILGAVILTGVAYWYMQDVQTLTPVKPLVDPVILQPKETPVADTFEDLILPKPASKPLYLVPIEPVKKDSEIVSGNDLSVTSPYKEVKRTEVENDKIILTPEELAKIGIRHKAKESLKYEVLNGRKFPLAYLHLGLNTMYREVGQNDTIRESDILSGSPYCAVFIEIINDATIHIKDHNDHIIYPKRTLICLDAIPDIYKETSFQHLKEKLIPVVAMVESLNGTVEVKFYFPPGEKLINDLPAGIHPKWSRMPVFDWKEYERYRELLYKRENSREDDIRAEAKRIMGSVKGIVLTDPKKLKKLGINYNGSSIKTQQSFTVGGKQIFIAQIRFRTGGTSLTAGTEKTLSNPTAPTVVFISDSSFLKVTMVTRENSTANEKDYSSLAINMADTLVPVIIPLKMTRIDRRRSNKDQSYKPATHKIFWYRRQDLERAGIRR